MEVATQQAYEVLRLQGQRDDVAHQLARLTRQLNYAKPASSTAAAQAQDLEQHKHELEQHDRAVTSWSRAKRCFARVAAELPLSNSIDASSLSLLLADLGHWGHRF